MSQPVQIAIILGFVAPLIIKARRDYISGLAYAVFVFVSMTTLLRIQMPGNLPQLTLHRIILVVLFLFWRKQRHLAGAPERPPARNYLLFWAVVNFASMLCTSVEFVTSFKRFLDYTLEIFLFYYIIATSLRTREDAYRVLRAAVSGLGLVALIAFVERYAGFNPVREYLAGDDEWSGIQSTYQHRILLGAAMAMGIPLVFALDSAADKGGIGRFRRWTILLMLMATCYFANSRGPWLACAIAMAVLALFGPPQFRRGLLTLGFCGLLVLALRPGVMDTLTTRASESADADSFKGGTLMYRIELWKVAWAQITKSPVRFLLGYGPGAGAEMSIEWKVTYRKDWTMFIESWDNHFASDFFQTGCLGLIATLALYFKLSRDMWQILLRAGREDRGKLACIVASVGAMLFMMTNVLIFAKQLFYLFWTVIAAGYQLTAQDESPTDELPMQAHDDNVEHMLPPESQGEQRFAEA